MTKERSEEGSGEGGVTGQDQPQYPDCCVIGGGPAGVVLSYLLAREGVVVTLLEAHKDFDREFRGDTLHPSTMELMDRLGLAERLLEIPHEELRRLRLNTLQGSLTVVDFGVLDTAYPYVTLMPQAEFLEFLVQEADRHPNFRLEVGAQARDLIWEEGRCRGVHYSVDGEERTLRADLVVAADGRFSSIRKVMGLEMIGTAPPMDVLWFRVPRKGSDDHDLAARIRGGRMLVILPRHDHYQLGFVIPKGSYRTLRDRGIQEFRTAVAKLAPELERELQSIQEWRDISALLVESGRLERWAYPGLLFIGDAAHIMSPVGGVGINYAIQDAVVAAELLAGPLKNGALTTSDLAVVQRRREWPTRLIQAFQNLVQRRLVRAALDPNEVFRPPRALQLPFVQRFLARLIGFGFGRNDTATLRGSGS